MVSRRRLAILVCGLMTVGCSAAPKREPPAPKQARLGGDRPTLLVFATVWCDVCRRERLDVERWARDHPTHRVYYVLSGSSEPAVAEFVRAQGFDTEVLTVVSDPDGRIAERYRVVSTPTLLLYGAGGALTGRYHRVDRIPEQQPAPPLVPVSDTGRELGTTYDVVVLAPPGSTDRARAALARARALCSELEARLSEWREDSEISRVNRLAAERRVPVSPILRRVLSGALHTSKATGGAFDVTWYPLGRLWEKARGTDRPPDRAAVDAARRYVGWSKVSLTESGVRFREQGVRLGLGAVAKGFIVDQVFHQLRRSGYEHVIVNIGGDLRTSGRDARGKVRRFGVRDPYDPTRIAVQLRAADIAIATSGNYARSRTIGGRTVGHIVDPRSGDPATFDGSVTVLTRDAAMADALATGLFVMGPDAGLALVARTPGVEAVFVTRTGLRVSPGAPVAVAGDPVLPSSALKGSHRLRNGGRCTCQGRGSKC